MIKGVFLVLGISLVMFASLLIPGVHLFTIWPTPFGPFIGGYFGIKFAQVPRESYAPKCLLFGGLVGSLFLVLSVLVVAIFVSLSDLEQRLLTLIWIGVGVATLYTASMSTLGAMFSVLRSEGQAGGQADGAVEASPE